MRLTRQVLAQMIDHTNLTPNATYAEIASLCNEARNLGLNAVCVNPSHIVAAKSLLASSAVKVCSVVAFPFGALPPELKALEARRAVELGASELDVVCNISAVKSGDFAALESEIAAIVETAPKVAVKIILETGYLTDEEIMKVCSIAKQAGAHFVKTCTGYGPRGAETRTVSLMRKTVGASMGVKAAGGIRTFEQAVAFIAAGASRIGTSTGPDILAGFREVEI